MSKVGIAKQAYSGAPKGIAQVWPDDLDLKPRPHWSWNKTTRNKLTVIHNPEYHRKMQALIDSI